jgi:outer membrane lipoprotein-sorting protein
MRKIVLVIMGILAISMLFFGCIAPGTNQITTEKDAAKAVADISSDLTGIKNSLNEVDNTLTDQNAS